MIFSNKNLASNNRHPLINTAILAKESKIFATLEYTPPSNKRHSMKGGVY